MPADSRAAATVSPLLACTGLPSTVRATAVPASASLLNMEPPRTEGSDQRLVEGTARDHGRDGEGVVGRERHTGMAAHGEGAGMAFRFIVDREAILGHHADGAPGAHDVGATEHREHAHRALGLGGADSQRQAGWIGAFLL